MRWKTDHISRFLHALLLIMFLYGCNKSEFQITDPVTGEPVKDLTTADGQCYVVKIAQKNKSATGIDNALEFQLSPTFIVNRIFAYDSLTGKIDYDIRVRTNGDTIALSTGEYFLLNSSTKTVAYFFTSADITDPAADRQKYEYIYNSDGYLIKKNLFVNNATTLLYQTEYAYDNNNLLTGCVLYAGTQKQKFLEASISYDLSQARKEWIYLFPDFFEGYQYLQALNFGKKGKYAIKSMSTKIYDLTNTSVIDTWNTSFSAYVISKDGFILQTTASGDLQQGLGVLYGITRFDYQCTK